MSNEQTASPPFLLLFILVALLSMFAASFQGFMQEGPAPTASDKARPGIQTETVPSEPLGIAGLPDGGSSLALTEKQSDDLSELMRRLQADPQDTEALIEISDTFLMSQDWVRAQTFLARAIASSPNDIRPRYMLGICLYQQGKMPEAAATFEKLLSLKEDFSAAYNLAIIYKYHLNEPEKAAKLFHTIVSSSDADVDTIEKAKKELPN